MGRVGILIYTVPVGADGRGARSDGVVVALPEGAIPVGVPSPSSQKVLIARVVALAGMAIAGRGGRRGFRASSNTTENRRAFLDGGSPPR
jgi:hypothetical protein